MIREQTVPTEGSPHKREANQSSPSQDARQLVRCARKAALGTIDKVSGHPHVSLVTVATDPDGSPLLLISRLAVHTQNLIADARASLMFDGTDAKGDPLAGGRVTLTGQGIQSASPTSRQRFLSRHPEAKGYADFPDFSFWRLNIERAHYIGGFGRIVPLAADQMTIDVSSASSLISSELEIVEHMNQDHADAVQLYATVLAGKPSGQWTLSGLDPEGIDLAEANGATARVAFDEPITNAQDARRELIVLVKRAREQG